MGHAELQINNTSIIKTNGVAPCRHDDDDDATPFVLCDIEEGLLSHIHIVLFAVDRWNLLSVAIDAAMVISNIRLEYGWMPGVDELEDVEVVAP